jgi:hypothetical protein
MELEQKFFNDRILKELYNKFELISYNKKAIVKNTWNGNNNYDNCLMIREIKNLILGISSHEKSYEKKLKKLIKNSQIIESLLDKINKLVYGQ